LLSVVSRPLTHVAAGLLPYLPPHRRRAPAPIVLRLLSLHLEPGYGHAHVLDNLGALLLSLESVGLLMTQLFHQILNEVLGLCVYWRSLRELWRGLIV
jgi:hypothetical protein